MNLTDFEYDLPAEFIAQIPAEPRDRSRLLVYSRSSGKTEIRHFCDITDYLKRGDTVVINTTRVMPARMFGTKQNTSTRIELLLLKQLDEFTYKTLVKPLKRLKLHEKLKLDDYTIGELLSKDQADGTAVMRFNKSVRGLGEIPLPHYIRHTPEDTERYQTVYGKSPGSVAAPTAGLHWTPELMEKAKQKGVTFCEIVLHVGIGTFRPVKTEQIEEHKMHSEYYEISSGSADIINKAKAQKHRVICVGTTSLRVLESVYSKYGTIRAERGETDIFIYPPYEFKVADCLITNFHLPRSTLLMLVSAFAGREKVLDLYEFAKKNNFRFFSFGDACLLQ